jgi:hypothetical protein
MDVVTTKDKLQGKLNDSDMMCMFVGYLPSHSCDVYMMLTGVKKRVPEMKRMMIFKMMIQS